nr:hypothetical protein B0A51_18388 [Rachicladosporium sp. CCFEE 5018]
MCPGGERGGDGGRGHGGGSGCGGCGRGGGARVCGAGTEMEVEVVEVVEVIEEVDVVDVVEVVELVGGESVGVDALLELVDGVGASATELLVDEVVVLELVDEVEELEVDVVESTALLDDVVVGAGGNGAAYCTGATPPKLYKLSLFEPPQYSPWDKKPSTPGFAVGTPFQKRLILLPAPQTWVASPVQAMLQSDAGFWTETELTMLPQKHCPAYSVPAYA